MTSERNEAFEIRNEIESVLGSILRYEETELWNDVGELRQLHKGFASIAHSIQSRITELETLSGQELEEANIRHQQSNWRIRSGALQIANQIAGNYSKE